MTMTFGLIQSSRKLVSVCRSSLTGVQTRSLSELKKRFYKQVTITNNDSRFELNLDGRKLKTPGGQVFHVTSEPLALAIANEWQAQGKEIKPNEMQLTALTNTALDNPMQLTSDVLIEQATEFLTWDTLCFHVEEPIELAAVQKQKWDPVLGWFEGRFGCPVNVSKTVKSPVLPNETRATVERHLASFSMRSLLGLEFVADNLKSLLLTMALTERRLSVEEAVNLSRLELDFQTKRWGNVEEAHDLELMNTRSRVSAGLLFFLFNNDFTEHCVKKSRSN